MAAANLRDLVVEVLHRRDDGWSVGSGFFVGKNLVLTAYHIVDGPGELLVRLYGTEKHPAKVRLQNDNDVDLTILEVDVQVTIPSLRYGDVVKDWAGLVEQCWAVGFPAFKVVGYNNPPASVQVNGNIPIATYLSQRLLTLQVGNDPRPQLKGSEWEGMSGAVVFSNDDIIVGVIIEHHLREGESALIVEPITAIDLLPEATKWWKLLGVDRQTFVHLPLKKRERAGGLFQGSGSF